MRPCPTAIGPRHCTLPDGHPGDHVITFVGPAREATRWLQDGSPWWRRALVRVYRSTMFLKGDPTLEFKDNFAPDFWQANPYYEADILAAAIERWRDTRGDLDDPDDRTLYDAAVWYRTWRDHGGRGVYAQASHR